MLKHKFPAKVLLLGEYTILSGSKALALPYWELSGQWNFDKKDTEDYELSRSSLKSFLTHNSVQYIDSKRLGDDIERGLWFDSSIPQGYGLGSSGALIAAIFNFYSHSKGNLLDDKIALGRLEDYFHGASSGLDPLVSHIQKPLLIHSFDEVEVLNRDLNLNGFFLLNTKKPRQTGPLVSIYQEKLKDPQFKQGCAEVLSKEVNFAIEAIMKNDSTNLHHHLWHISKFQWEYFPEMIPTQLRGIWTRGLESGDYILKLCGAGGGGFVLGHSQKYSLEEMSSILPEHSLRKI